MKITQPILLLTAAAMFSACTHRVADFTVCSTKNMDLNNATGYRTETNKRCEGKEISHTIILFPTKPFISLKEPVDQAIESQGSNCVGLANVTVEQGAWYIPFIYGQTWIKVEGDPIYIK